ncbi:MAG: exo-alpha-sialidase [bacterium]|nr:exo-alpha-sialidase [bacterium]
MKTRISLFITLVVIFICSSSCDDATKQVLYELLTIVGENDPDGVFDPSLEYASADAGWLAYSAVDVPEYVSTHIARSGDYGQTWTKVGEINESEDGTIEDGGTTYTGVWRHEVSTLVHTPNDPGKEWKLYWHRYFTREPYGDLDRLFQYGWIAYKYASDPAGPWSEEVALFGAHPYPSGGFDVEIYLNQLHPDLNDFVAFTEPGSLYRDGVIYLSLTGASDQGEAHFKNFLIRSSDNGATWEYVGILTDHNDASALGYEMLTATSLVESSGTVYLLASPWDDFPTDHDGTYVFEFEDIAEGTLKRNAKRELIVYKYLPPSVEGFSNAGESDYDEHNSYGGIVMPQTEDGEFRLYNTKEGL